MPKRSRLHPSLEDDDYDAFVELAKSIEVTPSWLARRAIKLFLDRYKKNLYQLKLDLNLPK